MLHSQSNLPASMIEAVNVSSVEKVEPGRDRTTAEQLSDLILVPTKKPTYVAMESRIRQLSFFDMTRTGFDMTAHPYRRSTSFEKPSIQHHPANCHNHMVPCK